jgi:hypothetical protein
MQQVPDWTGVCTPSCFVTSLESGGGGDGGEQCGTYQNGKNANDGTNCYSMGCTNGLGGGGAGGGGAKNGLGPAYSGGNGAPGVALVISYF